MKIEALTDDSIIVELSCDDMKGLNITYEEMDYSNVETKRVIWTVLSRARRALGKELDTSGGRLFVEAMRRESGGCVLFFCVERDSRPKRYLVKPQAEYITCEFDSAQSLYACTEQIAARHIRCDSQLYSSGKRFRLLIRPHSGLNALKACLAEYAEVVGDNAALTAHTHEHWHCIAQNGAVEKMSMN